MTVNQWIDENTNICSHKIIRMIDKDTHKGLGCHWIVFKDCEVNSIKITSKFIFIFV